MRARIGAARHQRNKKILKRVKGFRAGRRRLLRTAKEALKRSGRYGFFGRKQKKRDYRAMWIVRINAACELNGISYSRFINGLKKAKIELNRKALSELAISDAAAFKEIVEKSKAALAAAPAAK
jgi:large subunit ribosomal protein L20